MPIALKVVAILWLLSLAGCMTQPVAKPAAPMGSARVETISAAQGSKAAAAVQAAAAANASNPDGAPKQATAGELSVAAANLPQPTHADAAEALARANLALNGQLAEAERQWTAAKADAAKLAQDLAAAKTELASEQARSAKAIAALEKQLADSKSEYLAAQRRYLNWGFHGIGILCILAGIGCFTFASTLPMAGPKLGFGLIATGAGMIAAGIAVAWVFAHLWVLGIAAAVIAALGGIAYANHHHGTTEAKK